MTSRRVARGLALALAAAAAVAASLLLAPTVALAQQQPAPQGPVLVVALPFTGDATEDLLHDTEDAARNALLARGAQGPDRSTVRSAMGAAAPSDTQSIVGFGRSMGGTHVLTGEVTALTGQYNLRLRLYEVSSGRVAEQYRNVGEDESGTVVAQMVAALFAPGALQLSPEEQARLDAQRQQEEAARRQQEEERRRQQAAQQAEEQRRRQEEERRRREEAERNRHVYRAGEGGMVSLGAAGLFGGRLTAPPQRPSGLPEPSAFYGGLRFEGGYLVLPQYGVEVGGAALVVLSPTDAFTLGPSARIAFPAQSYLPLHGSAGAAIGIYQAFSGSRATSAWFGVDARAEVDIASMFTAFAGLELDAVPGSFVSLAGLVGFRVHFGDPSPDPRHPAPPSTPPPASGGTPEGGF